MNKTNHENNPEWADYSVEDLRKDQNAQIIIFEQMLHTLEKDGNCRYAYHRLAVVLFGDSMKLL